MTQTKVRRILIWISLHHMTARIVWQPNLRSVVNMFVAYNVIWEFLNQINISPVFITLPSFAIPTHHLGIKVSKMERSLGDGIIAGQNLVISTFTGASGRRGTIENKTSSNWIPKSTFIISGGGRGCWGNQINTGVSKLNVHLYLLWATYY